MNGTLIPLPEGDAIPLVKERIVLGRRKTCDVQLSFGNVSGKHCELTFEDGSWVVSDLGSVNGIMVNGIRVLKRRLHPGDDVTFARKHRFRIDYEIEGDADFEEMEVPFRRSSTVFDSLDEDTADGRRQASVAKPDSIFDNSLLERAGLAGQRTRPAPEDEIDTPVENVDGNGSG